METTAEDEVSSAAALSGNRRIIISMKPGKTFGFSQRAEKDKAGKRSFLRMSMHSRVATSVASSSVWSNTKGTPGAFSLQSPGRGWGLAEALKLGVSGYVVSVEVRNLSTAMRVWS